MRRDRITVLGLPAAANATVTQTFACANSTAAQVATAPIGAVSARVTLNGAAGSDSSPGVGGHGESERFTIPASGSQQFDVFVGCLDGYPQSVSGNGGLNVFTVGGSGGGASQLSPQGDDVTADAYAIAAGGGGAGSSAYGVGAAVGGNGGDASSPGGSDATVGLAGGNNSSEAPTDSGGGGGTGADSPGPQAGGAGGNGGFQAGSSGAVATSNAGGAGGGGGYNFFSAAIGGSGGGGGAGVRGGAGGGGGGAGQSAAGGGGGGGGGASYLAPSTSSAQSSSSVSESNGSVTIVYTIVGAITAPATQSFGQRVPTGSSQTETITFTNTGSGVDDAATVGTPSISGDDAPTR